LVTHAFRHVALAGAFNTKQARVLEGHTMLSISLEAVRGVLETTGVALDDVDGVFGKMAGEIGFSLGLGPAATTTFDASGISAVLDAAQAVSTGLCETALVVSGGASQYVDRNSTAPWTRPENEWVLPFGLYTAVEFALMARRHMHEFGTTPEQLASAAALIRNNGHVNPEAVYCGRGPFTAQDVLDSRMIADPFHLLDCAMTSEGACAVIVTTPERARDTKQKPVYILGAGLDRIGPAYQHAPSWDLSAARTDTPPAGLIGRRASRRALGMAGLTPHDVNVCELYDPFSFEIIRQLEAFEFCEVGAGGEFVTSGMANPDGRFPVTTDGGLLAFSHPGSPQQLQRVARAMHQIQGVCASNQIPNVDVALCSNGGSGALYTDVMVLGKEMP
jgi:acetyl-CoA acetyltransferase